MLVTIVVAAASMGSGLAYGQDNRSSYAIVIGANTGGPGQNTLRFAERDAANMTAVLASLGGYSRSHITELLQPTPAELRTAIRQLAAKVKAHKDRGDQTSVIFYYSGHARANSLNLGDTEVVLSELRSSLEELSSTLTVVILDACQSGSFSNIKGVQAISDFSVNSIASLNSTGMAVMASSSATELSQESERLGASYFSHYLMVALRGAGDDNADGRVTLNEAYRYAYNQTLAATAKTAVGKQHVTLETDLRGKGEIALSFPASLQTGIVLSSNTVGEFTFQAQKSGAVLAELYKANDREVRLALAPGQYSVIVRTGSTLQECQQRVGSDKSTPFAPTNCVDIAAEQSASKGAHIARPWSIELSWGIGSNRADAFTSRLENFGFEDTGSPRIPTIDLGVSRHISHRVWASLNLFSLDFQEFYRHGDTQFESYDYSSWGMTAALRYQHPILLSQDPHRGLFAFAEMGAGVTRAVSHFNISDGARSDPSSSDRQVHHSHLLTASAGLSWMIWKRLGLYSKARFAISPTIPSLLGETHDVGGWFWTWGIRGAFRGEN